MLLPVCLRDVRERKIPNGYVLACAVLAAGRAVVLAVYAKNGCVLADAGLGGLAGGLPVLLLALAVKNGMGMGDAKLAAVLGAALGPEKALYGLALGFVMAGLVSAGLLAAKKITLRSKIPFAPFLCGGAAAAFFAGGWLHAFLFQI